MESKNTGFLIKEKNFCKAIHCVSDLSSNNLSYPSTKSKINELKTVNKPPIATAIVSPGNNSATIGTPISPAL
ncbi:hypothetical protein DR192_00925 [Lawsonia intracellularis]|uniref:hypothetical protein n=1 Tax=Lawsonia intracellularis TaxID=29546 RepID=UPI0002DCF319|nr:hypothetical protein [Lawsonia intracellularis]KAA0204839.1 hypothetical protein C4K43_04060 [Lawsonia intracellularis]RBN34927.1 hypothetical protein DR192_00925 [Lawsonia intracellularis]